MISVLSEYSGKFLQQKKNGHLSKRRKVCAILLGCPLLVQWAGEGKQIKAEICKRYPYLKGKWEWVAKNSEWYGQPGSLFTSYTILGLVLVIYPKTRSFQLPVWESLGWMSLSWLSLTFRLFKGCCISFLMEESGRLESYSGFQSQ